MTWGEAACTQPDVDVYVARLFSGVTRIKLLSSAGIPLLRDGNSAWDPDFFLASISPSDWIPHAVQVSYENVAGIVYFKERKFAGLPTGVIYADAILGASIAAEAKHCEKVFSLAIRHLVSSRRPRALRLLVPQDVFECATISRIASSVGMEMAYLRTRKHSVLALPSTYDCFLERLGPKTRKNFRYYRHRFEAAGGHYAGSISLENFCSATWSLKGKSNIYADRASVKRRLNMLSVVREPMLVGLQSSGGEWLSVAGGWYENERATFLFQMNSDRERWRDSLSQVLRAYLIEALIARRVRELVFWAGTSAPLVRYAERIPATALYLDSRKLHWRLFRTLVASSKAILPKRLVEFGFWITPWGTPSD